MRWCSLPLFAALLLLPLRAQQPDNAASLLLPDMPLHDPWMVANAADHTYYLYTSNIPRFSGTAGAGTMVYRSQDMKHWQRPVSVFQASEVRWASQGAWAPEVHLWKGRYYLFTTVMDDSKPLSPEKNNGYARIRRGTISAVSESPLGPFHPLQPDAPLPPPGFMTLDGTLYVDRAGKPFLVYAHEWVQKNDGTIEAIPLKDDLSAAAGDPVFLFKGSDAPWLDGQMKPDADPQVYVTDGPELFRTRDGHLLMLWSSYEFHGGYVQTVARSESGELRGPWVQLPPLVKQDSGHGMLFHTFDGGLMLVLHRPFKNARGKLYEMRDAGDHLEVLRERTDLDGDAAR